MSIVDFTSFDDVRAALGVSDDEIKDTTLSLDLYDFNLVSELEGISLDLISDFKALPEINDRTEVQTRFFQSTKLFATYAVAKQCTISVPMFAPKEQTDGKAGLVRFALDPYKTMIARVVEQYETFKTKLETAYAALNAVDAPPAVERNNFVAVGLAVDPVTGA